MAQLKDTVISGGLRVTNGTYLSNILNVTGATTLSSTLNVTGAATLGSTLGVTGATTLAGITSITNNTSSSAYNNGALIVSGGVGIAGAINTNSTLKVAGATTLNSTLGVSGVTTITNNGAGTSSSTGALRVTGGISTGAASFLTGSVIISGTAANNALQVRGISGCANTGIRGTAAADKELYLNYNGGLISLGINTNSTDKVEVAYTTAATNTTSGALVVGGGVGISKSLYIGEGITITNSNEIGHLVFSRAPSMNNGNSAPNYILIPNEVNSSLIFGIASNITTGNSILKLVNGGAYTSGETAYKHSIVAYANTQVGTTGLTATFSVYGDTTINGTTRMNDHAFVYKDTQPRLGVRDNTTGNNLYVALMIGSNHLNHGVYSPGYCPTASTFTSDGQWLVYRDETGSINLPGNASTATKLENARIIWGRSFDGSADITSGPVFNRTATGAFWTIRQNDVTCGHMELATLGPANTEGRVTLYLGNASSKAEANNASGRITLYNSSGVSNHVSSRLDALYGDLLGNSVNREYLDISTWAKAVGMVGAVWNDYAEFRSGEITEGGYCVHECEDGIMRKSANRLEPGCRITSDTFGFAIGATANCKTPIAVSGRVLAYPTRARNEYKLGAAVCSGPNGTVDIMTRNEIMMYPERIVGIVSEIPNYDIWSCGDEEMPTEVQVNGRIWIYIK